MSQRQVCRAFVGWDIPWHTYLMCWLWGACPVPHKKGINCFRTRGWWVHQQVLELDLCFSSCTQHQDTARAHTHNTTRHRALPGHCPQFSCDTSVGTTRDQVVPTCGAVLALEGSSYRSQHRIHAQVAAASPSNSPISSRLASQC